MSSMHRPVAKLAIVMSLLGALRLSLRRGAIAPRSVPADEIRSERAFVGRGAAHARNTCKRKRRNPATKRRARSSKGRSRSIAASARRTSARRMKRSRDFTTFLRMQPNASIDSAVHSIEAVAAFDAARRKLADRRSVAGGSVRVFRGVGGRDRGRSGRQVLGGRSGALDPHGPGKEGMGRPDGSQHAGRVRRTLLGRARGAARRGKPELSSGIRASRRFRGYLPRARRRGTRESHRPRHGLHSAGPAPDRLAQGSSERGGSERALGTVARRDPGGQTRVEGRLEEGHGVGDGAKVSLWARYQGPEHRALSTDEEFLEVWQYELEQLPRGIPYPRVDVHYVTQEGSRKERPAAEHREHAMRSPRRRHRQPLGGGRR